MVMSLTVKTSPSKSARAIWKLSPDAGVQTSPAARSSRARAVEITALSSLGRGQGAASRAERRAHDRMTEDEPKEDARGRAHPLALRPDRRGAPPVAGARLVGCRGRHGRRHRDHAHAADPDGADRV